MEALKPGERIMIGWDGKLNEVEVKTVQIMNPPDSVVEVMDQAISMPMPAGNYSVPPRAQKTFYRDDPKRPGKTTPRDARHQQAHPGRVGPAAQETAQVGA